MSGKPTTDSDEEIEVKGQRVDSSGDTRGPGKTDSSGDTRVDSDTDSGGNTR